MGNKAQGVWTLLKNANIEYGEIISDFKTNSIQVCPSFFLSQTKLQDLYILKYSDNDNEISGPYSNVISRAEGFIIADTAEHERYYIDVLGRFSAEATKSGAQIFSYLNNYLKLENIDSKFFSDDLFYQTVLREEKERALYEIKSSYADKEKLSSFDVERYRNRVAILEAKRENKQEKVDALKQYEADLIEKRKEEKEEVSLTRVIQNEDIEYAFDSAMEHI